MKKIITVLVLALLIVSVPYAAMAADYKALEQKALAFASQGMVTTQQVLEYNYAATFAYADTANEWWCGLAITSLDSNDNDFMIGAFDSTGAPVATGIFTLSEFGQQVDLIQGFMDTGAIDGRISISIFSTGAFLADRFQGNDQGGFGELEKEGVLY